MASARTHHISSAVIACKPDNIDAIVASIEQLDNVEVHGFASGKIVVVIEGKTTGQLGDSLMAISLLDGVIAANMVFEHVEIDEGEMHGQRTDAA